jgi:hypothetical protein
LSKPSGTHSGLSSDSVVHMDFRSPKPGCKDRTTEVSLHWPLVMSKYG